MREKQAIEDFSTHEVVELDLDRGYAYIRRKDKSSTHAAEIIALKNGRLFVGGDIDDCVFGYYRDPAPDKATAFYNRVHWIGDVPHVDRYVTEKAMIGLTDGGRLTYEWSVGVVERELKCILEEDDCTQAQRETIHELMPMLHETEAYEVLISLRDADIDIASLFGLAPSSRVVYAWAACRRLKELLPEQIMRRATCVV